MAAPEKSPTDLPLGKYRHPATGQEVELRHQSLAEAFKRAGFEPVKDEPVKKEVTNKKEGK